MELKKGKPLPNVPGDLQALIGGLNWHFSHDDALRYRKELMEERSRFVTDQTKHVVERLFR